MKEAGAIALYSDEEQHWADGVTPKGQDFVPILGEPRRSR
ncbi:hypothetical protein AKJ09_11059 [Labilithrix luteola]|uniref:Uncharacterized protein n=1 Tax=Labilithrix luteola TaxID=1391654 RepID=A0A0K1QF46_9BACT|nr:hypothetical protein AKJ09_11059 [Labilithrix luteola]